MTDRNKPNHIDREDLYTIIIVYINDQGFRKGCKWKHILLVNRAGSLRLKENTKRSINQLFPTAFVVDVYGGISGLKVTTFKKYYNDF